MAEARAIQAKQRIVTPDLLPDGGRGGPALLFGPDGVPVRGASSADPNAALQYEGRWPGTSVPLTPVMPAGAEPRVFHPFVGYNLSYLPRSEWSNISPFTVLRQLADACDALRIVIEDVKQQVLGLSWDIKPREKSNQTQGAAVEAVKRAMERPDGYHDWHQWLSAALEEMLVIDALSVYRLRTKAGDPYALLVLDGSWIKPLLDFHGIPPFPPAAAYQQIVMGRVESEFTRPWGTADKVDPEGRQKYELCYLPRHTRSHTPYGQSPVERVLVTVNLILRRQYHYLAFYTDGTLPEAFYRLPETYTSSQVAQFQQNFDELMAGESAYRRRITFMPGGANTGLDNPRGHDQWSYEFEEFLHRVIAWAFQVSCLPVAKMMNRATSEQADVAETDSGMKPTLKFLKAVIDSQIREFYGYEGVEFIWTDAKKEDEAQTREKAVQYVDRGIYTINEVREREGLEKVPWGDVPQEGMAGEPEVYGGTNGGGSAREILARVPKIPAAGAAGNGAAQAGEREQGSVAGERSEQDVEQQKAIAAELRKWRKVAVKAVKEGKRPRAFRSDVLVGSRKQALDEWLSEARSVDDVTWAFGVLAKARRPLIAARRRIRLERRLRRKAREHFDRVAGKVAAVAVDLFRLKAQKAAGDEAIDGAMEWRVFMDAIVPGLEEAFLDGEVVAADAGRIEVDYSVSDEQAREYAKKRGAELVGMRVTEDGSIVENPNPKWSVPQTVRDQIRQTIDKALAEEWTEKQLQEAIEGGAIWDWRSDMIARTEVAFALNAGTVETYRSAGVEQVEVLDGPGCLRDGHDDTERGVSGERWTLEEAEADPIGHPNCRRDFAPVMDAEG